MKSSENEVLKGQKMGKEVELTIKQEQVLSLAAKGLRDQLIAETLGISVRTVQNHLARIYAKMQTNNRVGAIVLYMSTKVEVVKRHQGQRKRRNFKGQKVCTQRANKTLYQPKIKDF